MEAKYRHSLVTPTAAVTFDTSLFFERGVDDLLHVRLLLFGGDGGRVLLQRRGPVLAVGGHRRQLDVRLLGDALAFATSAAIRVMRRISSSVTIGLLANPQTPL